MLAPQGLLLLATVVGQPVGCIGLRPFPREGTCEMKRLYVRPAFRGGKLGRELAERLLDEARRLGYSSMRLDSYASLMQSAVGLYRKLGFREVSPEPHGAGGRFDLHGAVVGSSPVSDQEATWMKSLNSDSFDFTPT